MPTIRVQGVGTAPAVEPGQLPSGGPDLEAQALAQAGESFSDLTGMIADRLREDEQVARNGKLNAAFQELDGVLRRGLDFQGADPADFEEVEGVQDKLGSRLADVDQAVGAIRSKIRDPRVLSRFDAALPAARIKYRDEMQERAKQLHRAAIRDRVEMDLIDLATGSEGLPGVTFLSDLPKYRDTVRTRLQAVTSGGEPVYTAKERKELEQRLTWGAIEQVVQLNMTDPRRRSFVAREILKDGPRSLTVGQLEKFDLNAGQKQWLRQTALNALSQEFTRQFSSSSLEALSEVELTDSEDPERAFERTLREIRDRKGRFERDRDLWEQVAAPESIDLAARAFDEIEDSVLDNVLRFETGETLVARGGGNPSNPSHVDAVNYFTELRWRPMLSDPDMSDQEKADMIVEGVENLNFVPQVAAEYMRGIDWRDPEDVEFSVQLIRRARAQLPVGLQTVQRESRDQTRLRVEAAFDKDTLQLVNQVEIATRSGKSVAEALDLMSRQREQTPETEELRRRWSAGSDPAVEGGYSVAVGTQIQQYLTQFDAGWGDYEGELPPGMVGEARYLAELNFYNPLFAGSFTQAMQATAAELSRNWGVSKVAGNVTPMRLPPEKHYGAKQGWTQPGKAMRDQFNQDMRALFGEDFTLFRNMNEPQYQLALAPRDLWKSSDEPRYFVKFVPNEDQLAQGEVSRFLQRPDSGLPVLWYPDIETYKPTSVGGMGVPQRSTWERDPEKVDQMERRRGALERLFRLPEVPDQTTPEEEGSRGYQGGDFPDG